MSPSRASGRRRGPVRAGRDGRGPGDQGEGLGDVLAFTAVVMTLSGVPPPTPSTAGEHHDDRTNCCDRHAKRPFLLA